MPDAALAASLKRWSDAHPTADAPFERRWAAVAEGLDLLERAYVAGDRQAIGDALVGISDLRQLMLSEDEHRERDHALEAEVGQMENRLDDLLADTGIPREVLVRELEGMRLRRQQLRTFIEGGKPQKHLDNDLDAFGRAATRLEGHDPLEAEELHEAERALRGQAVAVATSRTLAKLDAADELDHVELWRSIGDLERLIHEAYTLDGTEEQIATLLARREALLKDAATKIDALDATVRGPWLAEVGEDERERIEETLSAVEEVSLPAATAALQRAIGRVDFLVARWDDKSDPLAKALAKARKRLTDEWVEKSVYEGLEGRFGGTFVTVLENTVLVLILVVCGLLAVEFTFKEWAQTYRYQLAWADGAICAVFLFEFAIKIFYAPLRGNFFRRHWLIDLLPSIPFGLITLYAMPAVAGAQSTTAIRIARFLRLPRLARYIRLARPLIRVMRIAIFALRGLDRVVRKYGRLINRNIIFFDPPPETDDQDLLYRLDSLRLRTRGATMSVLKAMDAHARAAHHHLSENVIGARLDRFEELKNGASEERHEGPSRDIRIERVIDNLIRLEADELAEHFGPDFTSRVAKLTRIASLPVLRWLPIIRDVAKAREGTTDEAELVTRSARALGRALQRVLALMYFFTDLYGVLSPSQLIDKLGATMAKVAERPAKRLIMFGAIFLMLMGTLHLLPIDALQALTDKLARLLGLPIIILGVVCFLIRALGKWFQKVAGEASEFYERAAEAQFIGLVKDVKRGMLDDHRRWLEDRILRPEAALRGVQVTTVSRGSSDFAHRLAAVLDPSGKLEPGGAAERVYLLYRHFLDGAPLHRSGATTTNQLLGNLIIENVQRERLGYTKKQLKTLEALDLERHKGIGGPALWFNFITLAIAQRTARLVVEYNLHCIPLREHALYSEQELRASKAWLSVRHGTIEDDEHPEPLSPSTHYRTAAFTAIDFLTCDPQRDGAIAEAFGDDVAASLREDRQAMIREVFGTFPFASWPRADRSVNPAEIYWAYIGGGRALLLPLAIFWAWIRVSWWLFKQLVKTIRDLLNPAFGATADRGAVSSYEVAERKINRLRKPVFMEATRLRAAFDFEYLGLQVPGAVKPPDTGRHGYRHDLTIIGALHGEVEQFTALKREHRDRLQLMADFVRVNRWESPGLTEYLSAEVPMLVGREAEVLRAIAVAFVIDYRSCATLMRLSSEIEYHLAEAQEHGGRLAGQSRAAAVAASVGRAATAWTPPAFKVRGAFDRYWAKHHGDKSDEERLNARTYARACKPLARLLRRAARVDDDPLAAVREIVEDVAHHPQTWTEQLLTVRTVQSLALLDVLTDRRLVRDLGQYTDADEPPQPVALPWI